MSPPCGSWQVAQPCLERRLVRMGFLLLFRLLGMARQAGIDGIGLDKARRLPGVRIVAGDAFALRSGMLDLGGVDLLGLLVMAGHAQRLGVRLGQDNLAVFGGLVAGVARTCPRTADG